MVKSPVTGRGRPGRPSQTACPEQPTLGAIGCTRPLSANVQVVCGAHDEAYKRHTAGCATGWPRLVASGWQRAVRLDLHTALRNSRRESRATVGSEVVEVGGCGGIPGGWRWRCPGRAPGTTPSGRGKPQRRVSVRPSRRRASISCTCAKVTPTAEKTRRSGSVGGVPV
jgi:hypothetical protein